MIRDLLSARRPPVVLLASNNYNFVKGLIGIWKAGCPAVPLCNTHPPKEWEYYINDSRAPLSLVEPSFAPSMAQIATEKKHASVLLPDHKISPSRRPLEPFLSPNADALFVYTSGTTGKPKGVVTTHSNLEASTKAMTQSWMWNSSDHILHVLPLHHVHGLVNALITPLSVGATVEMLPKFDAKTVWSRFVESYQSFENTFVSSPVYLDNTAQFNSPSSRGLITVFMAVPPIYVALIKEYDSSDPATRVLYSMSLKTLRLMVSGSAALPEPILRRWEEISGHRLLERYGMTEIGMALTNPYIGGERKPGWVGKPFPGVQAYIKPDSDHTSSSDSIIGELHIKGPQVFKKYWHRKEATAESFDSEGWFMTGDTAEFDKKTGYYRILGRRSVDILKTGGYKVSALDIEAEILNHPEIHEAAVVGIEDIEWGQIVGAVVSLRSSDSQSQLDLNSLQEWLRPRMASYKLPRRLIIVPQIPRNAMGKVNKKDLIELFPVQEEQNVNE